MRCAQINIRHTDTDTDTETHTHGQTCVARGQRVNVAKQMMIAVRQMKCPQDKQQQKKGRQRGEQKKKRKDERGNKKNR